MGSPFVGRIEIRQTHDVTELVAECTDTVSFAVTVQLIETAVVIHPFAVEFEVSACVSEVILVRPDGVCSTATCFSFAGIEDNDPVHFSVFVDIVFTEVDTLFRG